MGEEGDALTFVANWIARKYDEELSPTSLYNDLNSVFRSKFGRNALGLRNALQHYARLGEIEASKGANYSSQLYTIAGTSNTTPPPAPEVISLQTEDNAVASAANNNGNNEGGDAKYLFLYFPFSRFLFYSILLPFFFTE